MTVMIQALDGHSVSKVTQVETGLWNWIMVTMSTSDKTMADKGQKRTCQRMEPEATENSGQESCTQEVKTR